MSKLKRKIISVEENYYFRGDEMKLYEERVKDTNMGRIDHKSVIYEKFKSTLKNATIKLLSDIKNYTNTLECRLCHEEIQDLTAPNHCHIYTEDREHFITFHFLCALKPDSVENFQEIMGQIDYIYYIDK